MLSTTETPGCFMGRKLILLTILLLCSAVTYVVPAAAQNYTIIHNFAAGDFPNAGVTLNAATNLYGNAGEQTVYRMRKMGANWLFFPLYEFNGLDGEQPAGRITLGADGTVYGAAQLGGIFDCGNQRNEACGLIFHMQPSATTCETFSCYWTETPLYQFDPVNHSGDGWSPNGGLTFDSAGNIYGTAQAGGTGDSGTVFVLSPSQGGWTETTIHTFNFFIDGGPPNGNLVIDRGGNLIGTTQAGSHPGCGGEGCGVVFELTPTSSGWVETILHEFAPGVGYYTIGGLISDAAGNLYGTTLIGGTNGGPTGGGTVFELTPSNGSYTFQVLHNFTGAADQYGPIGLLAIDSSGNLYGATLDEGAFGLGSVFKLTNNGGQWIYSDLHDFTGDGENPADGPTVDPSGNLYGTAYPGGNGVVWEITP